MSVLCPVCLVGDLHTAHVEEVISYAGAPLHVQGVEISRCSHCSEEIVLPEQLKKNERTFADAKRCREGLLTSDEIVRWRDHLGLTQSQAASMLGGGVNAFSKYERGEVIQSRPMDLLMRVSAREPGALRYLQDRAGIPASNGWRVIGTVCGEGETTPVKMMINSGWHIGSGHSAWRDDGTAEVDLPVRYAAANG